MDTVLTIVIIYLVFNTLIWIVRHSTLSKAKKSSEILDSRCKLKEENTYPKVSVLVAGKNEEKNIERCLRSLLAQQYPNLEIIAINDRSDDRTGQIMDQLAEQSVGRLRIVHVAELAEGWLGKPHAMHEGQKLATGDYLIFTDADCFFQCPDAIQIGVQFAREKKVDMLSILPILETTSFWERVLQPVCSVVMMLWYRPERVNNPNSRIAYANGAFMLFTRDCYNRLGGHPAVKDLLMEDMGFARQAKKLNLKLYIVQNGDLYRTRMYEDFSSTFAGWSRIFYGCFAKKSFVMLAAIMIFIMSLLPYLILIGALGVATVRGWQVYRPGWFILAFAGFAVAAQLSVLARFYKLTGHKWYAAFGYPLGASITFVILINALKKFMGGKIVWRGSHIKHKNVRLAK